MPLEPAHPPPSEVALNCDSGPEDNIELPRCPSSEVALDDSGCSLTMELLTSCPAPEMTLNYQSSSLQRRPLTSQVLGQQHCRCDLSYLPPPEIALDGEGRPSVFDTVSHLPHLWVM